MTEQTAELVKAECEKLTKLMEKVALERALAEARAETDEQRAAQRRVTAIVVKQMSALATEYVETIERVVDDHRQASG